MSGRDVEQMIRDLLESRDRHGEDAGAARMSRRQATYQCRETACSNALVGVIRRRRRARASARNCARRARHQEIEVRVMDSPSVPSFDIPG
jgi:hypothetical protein